MHALVTSVYQFLTSTALANECCIHGASDRSSVNQVIGWHSLLQHNLLQQSLMLTGFLMVSNALSWAL